MHAPSIARWFGAIRMPNIIFRSSRTGNHSMKVWQQPLPPIYQQLSDPELRIRIQSAKETLGEKLVILGHHYQQDAVIEFADFTGDSFELSRRAADQKNAEYVIFCGVHF